MQCSGESCVFSRGFLRGTSETCSDFPDKWLTNIFCVKIARFHCQCLQKLNGILCNSVSLTIIVKCSLSLQAFLWFPTLNYILLFSVIQFETTEDRYDLTALVLLRCCALGYKRVWTGIIALCAYADVLLNQCDGFMLNL